MIKENQIIKIEKVSYLGDYKLKLAFNDKSEQSIDFYPFLSNSLNPLIRKYLDEKKFKAYEMDEGDLEWNDYDLCFPIADLYENIIRP